MCQIFTSRKASNRLWSGAIFIIPIAYGISLFTAASLDLASGKSNLTFILSYFIVGALSLLIGVTGLYGVIRRKLYPIQATFMLLILETTLAFIIGILILLQLVSEHAAILNYDPGPSMEFLVKTKWAGGLVVGSIFVVSIMSCSLMWVIADYQSELEVETYEERLEKIKRQNSVEQLEREFEVAETKLLLEPGIDATSVALREQKVDTETESDEEGK